MFGDVNAPVVANGAFRLGAMCSILALQIRNLNLWSANHSRSQSVHARHVARNVSTKHGHFAFRDGCLATAGAACSENPEIALEPSEKGESVGICRSSPTLSLRCVIGAMLAGTSTACDAGAADTAR